MYGQLQFYNLWAISIFLNLLECLPRLLEFALESSESHNSQNSVYHSTSVHWETDFWHFEVH